MSTAATSASRPGTVSGSLLVVLASLAALAPVATDLYLPGFPAMGRDLDVSPSAVQLTLTAFLAGLAFGQLGMGPLSDRYGRRRPLVASATVCLLAGVVCAVTPSLGVLVMARFVQGLAGAGGMVIGRAVIADLVAGPAAARAFTLMLTIGGVAPVLAPVVGGLLSDSAGWRGLLWTVAGLCAVMLVGVVVALPETRPREVRAADRTPYVAAARLVGRTRGYWPPMLVFAMVFTTLSAYISASPFVYEEVIGLSPLGYGIAFGVNAAGLILAGWVTGRVVAHIGPRPIVRASVGVQLAAALLLVALAAAGAPPWLLCLPIFVAVTCCGGAMGNAAALAMGQVRPVAGMGSALLGFAQFALGAVVTPLVGLGGEHAAIVPAVVMATSAAIACAAARWLPHP